MILLTEKFGLIVKIHNHVDILINNAGVGNEQDMQRLVDVNVVSKLFIAPRAVIKRKKEKKFSED